jgi:hypothetical protein
MSQRSTLRRSSVEKNWQAMLFEGDWKAGGPCVGRRRGLRHQDGDGGIKHESADCDAHAPGR